MAGDYSTPGVKTSSTHMRPVPPACGFRLHSWLMMRTARLPFITETASLLSIFNTNVTIPPPSRGSRGPAANPSTNLPLAVSVLDGIAGPASDRHILARLHLYLCLRGPYNSAMRDWSLTPDDPYSLHLSADARL